MKAAVVSAFDQPPAYQDVPDPQPTGADEVVVEVLAAGLHPRVRSQADGSHYTSTGVLPLVPGVDGVGRDPEGVLRYFVLPDTTLGSMAERTVIDRRRSIVLPEETDPALVAAAMNPAMSSWVGLRQRIDFRAGQNVLVLGATGNAGQLAIQVARHLGADQVIAVSRGTERLERLRSLGATEVVALDSDAADEDLGRAAADVDVVVDYLWGEPAAAAMVPIVTDRTDRGKPLTWLQIGSVAGATAAIPSAALRAARLQIVGSGQGSVPAGQILAELPELVAEVSRGTLDIAAEAVPLSEVTAAWTQDTTSGRRLVMVP